MNGKSYVLDCRNGGTLEFRAVNLFDSSLEIVSGLIFNEAKKEHVSKMIVSTGESKEIFTLCRHAHERLQNRLHRDHRDEQNL